MGFQMFYRFSTRFQNLQTGEIIPCPIHPFSIGGKANYIKEKIMNGCTCSCTTKLQNVKFIPRSNYIILHYG